MSKELDKAWITIYHYNDELIHDMGSEYIENPLKEELDIVNNALLRLKEIDNANPSEALECLERIDNTLCLNNIKGKLEFGIDTEEHTDCDSVIGMTEDLDTIKQALLKAQEQEKENARYKRILSIIKEKNVDIQYLKRCKNAKQYNKSALLYEELLNEEFDLLKEMLKDE